nr:hypothetical protein [Tanacetum cinerariifolium]
MANFPRIDALAVDANSRGLFEEMLVYYDRDNARDLEFANGLHNLWVELLELGLSQLWDVLYNHVNKMRMLSSELNLFKGPLAVQCVEYLKQFSKTEVLRMLELRNTIAEVHITVHKKIDFVGIKELHEVTTAQKLRLLKDEDKKYAKWLLLSSSSDFEVSSCSKACLKSYETLKDHYDNLTIDFNKSQFNLSAYKAGLAFVEARLEVYKKNEAVFKVDITILKLDVMLRDKAITELRQKFEKAEKERDNLKLTLEKFEGSSKNLSRLLDSQQSDKSKTGLGYDSQGVDSQVLENQVNDKYNSGEGYHAVLPPYTENYMPPKPDLVFADEHVVFESEDEDEIETESKQIKLSFAKVKFVKSTEHVKSPRKFVKQEESNRQTKYPRKNSQSPRDCTSYKKKKVVEKPVWNNARRVNHQNFQRLSHPHSKGNFVPKAVLTNSGLKTLNTARQTSSRAAISVNIAIPINTAYRRLTVNGARPALNVFNKAHPHIRRPFNKFTTNKNSNFTQKVNNVKGNVTTVGSKTVVRNKKGNGENAVKSSASWIWRPAGNVIDHNSKDSGSYMLKRFNYVDLQGRLKSRLMVDLLHLEEIPMEEKLLVKAKQSSMDGFGEMITTVLVFETPFELKLVKTVNEDVRLQDLVGEKNVIVNETSIRRDLRLDDAEGNTCLSNAAIFEELARMRKHKSRRKQRKETEVSQDEPPIKKHIPTPSHDPLPSAEIAKLKKRVKKLEGLKKKRTHVLKRLYKGRMNDQDMFKVNDLDGDEVVVDVSAGEKEEQSEKVAEKEVSTADPFTTAGEVVTTADVKVSATLTTTTTEDELTLAQTFIEMKVAKPKAITTAATTVTDVSTRPKKKGIIIQEPPKTPSPKPISSSQPSQLPQAKDKEIVDERLKKTQAEVIEGGSKRARDEIEQESAKRQRLGKEDDTAELKRCLEIVPEDNDDVTVEATPLL